MQVFDASSMVYGWDNYPIEVFPKLWEWIAEKVADGEVTLSQISFDEVQHVSPDCAGWLLKYDVTRHEVGNQIVICAMEIKVALGIENDNYHSDGVDENDIIAVATAQVLGVALISDEARQPNLPVNIKRYRIPAVCDMDAAQVQCLNFLEYLKGSNQVFG